MRWLARTTVVLSVTSTACADPSALTRPDLAVLDRASFARPVRPSPVIDGIIRAGEYDGADTASFEVTLPDDGRRTPVNVRFTHDGRYLYAAATFNRGSSFHAADNFLLEFDNDNDGLREDGDDLIGSNSGVAQNTPVPGFDFYRFDGGRRNQSDASAGGTNEVLTAWSQSTTNLGTFEVRHDLNSADDLHDFSIDPSRRAQSIGVQFTVSLEADPIGSGVMTHTLYPSATTYCRLTISKKAATIICP